MRIVTTKKFRANQNTYMTLAMEEDVYITRPGGKLLRLSAVSDRDVVPIKNGYGQKPDKLITEKSYDATDCEAYREAMDDVKEGRVFKAEAKEIDILLNEHLQ